MGTLNRICKLAGIRMSDFERVYLGFPAQIAALQNGAIDVAFPTEPMASEAVRRGLGVAFMNDDEIYPGHQISVLVYSDQFRSRRPRVAAAFMRAYLRAVRAENASIVEGRLAGPDADEFAELVVENTPVKDRALIRSINLSMTDDDGRLKVDSLAEDLGVYRSEGLIQSDIRAEDAVDESFAREAAAALDAREKGTKR